MTGADMITVPRPGPDEYVVAVCTEDGAIAWLKGSKVNLPNLHAQLMSLTAENETRVHDRVFSEADRIREGMAEAQANPGRRVTVWDDD
jgi:hypothetical protein